VSRLGSAGNPGNAGIAGKANPHSSSPVGDGRNDAFAAAAACSTGGAASGEGERPMRAMIADMSSAIKYDVMKDKKPKFRIKNGKGQYTLETARGYQWSKHRKDGQVYRKKSVAIYVRNWLRKATNDPTWKVVRSYPAKSPVQPIPGDVCP
jgi:hypothetical protein